MNTDPEKEAAEGDDDTLGSPYGPFPHGADETAGGADSSPFEDEASEERKPQAESDEEAGRDADPAKG